MNEMEVVLSIFILLLLVLIICLNGRCNELEKEIEDLKWHLKNGF